MHKMKKARRQGQTKMLEMAGEVGVNWTGRILNVCSRREGYRKSGGWA